MHAARRRGLPGLSTLIAAVALALAATPTAAAPFRILPDESDLVVVTRKGGIAAAMAHDHVIAASGYVARLEFVPGEPESTTFELELPVRELVVDDPEIQARIAPRLEELGIREGPFSKVSGKDRSRIREAMLDADQLDAARHPTLSAAAAVIGGRQRAEESGEPLPFVVRLQVVIRDRTVEREAAARYDYRDGRLEVEALASFEFSEFGIEPYSAFFGAVRNRNEFHVYVRLTAVKETRPAGPATSTGSEGENPS